MRIVRILVAAVTLLPMTAMAQGTLSLTSGPSYTYVRHLQVAAEVRGNAAAQPAPTAIGTAACLRFENNQGTAEYGYFQWEMPADWTGGNITVEIDWAPESEMSSTEAVGWTVEYGSRAEGEALGGATTTVPVTVDADILANVTTHTPFVIAYNDATNPLHHEDHVFFRIGRVNGGVDTYADNVCVFAFEIIYTSNTFPEGN